jgi:stringent starvation protein B
VQVPKDFIKQERVVLNIAFDATNTLVINNEAISFQARFSDKSEALFIPIQSVLSIYANENGEGMFFESHSAELNKNPTLTLLD